MTHLNAPERNDQSITADDIERIALTLQESLQDINRSKTCIRMVARALFVDQKRLPSGEEVHQVLKQLSLDEMTSVVAVKALNLRAMKTISGDVFSRWPNKQSK